MSSGRTHEGISDFLTPKGALLAYLGDWIGISLKGDQG